MSWLCSMYNMHPSFANACGASLLHCPVRASSGRCGGRLLLYVSVIWWYPWIIVYRFRWYSISPEQYFCLLYKSAAWQYRRGVWVWSFKGAGLQHSVPAPHHLALNMGFWANRLEQYTSLAPTLSANIEVSHLAQYTGIILGNFWL